MFGKTDIFNLRLIYFDEDNNILGIHKIGSSKIDIPSNIKKVSLEECSNNEERILNNYYIGNMSSFKDLLNNSSKTIDTSKLNDTEYSKLKLNDNVLYALNDDKIVIEKILNKDERVFNNRLKLIHHLYKLSSRLEIFYKESNEVKTLIYK